MTASRIVLDTKVLVSAILFGGRPREVLEKVLSGKCGMAISDKMLREFRGVLEGRKFRYPAAVVRSMVNELLTVADLVQPKMKVDVIKADPPDNRILECALEGGADRIVTDDRHLLEIGHFKDIPILDVATFLEER